MMPKAVTAPVKKVTRVSVDEMKSCVFVLSASDEMSSTYARKVGMKATETLFSAKSLRKRFGS